MKILLLSPYVTINSRPEFSRNKTGFGYMVYDIAKAVAKTEQVDVFCTDSRGEGFVQDGINFLPRNMTRFLKNLFRSNKYLQVAISLLKTYSMSRGCKSRVIYYWLISGLVEKIIRDGHYDIVHVHGCGFSGELWEAVSKKCYTKIVYTLHGLNSFSDTVKLESAGKQYERNFLKKVVDGEYYISVISSGMKNIIQGCYYSGNCKNIVVISNSYSFEKSTTNAAMLDISLKYNIPKGAKIVLCVGNISERKNQMQLVRAYSLLSKKMQDNTYILFLGRYSEKDPIVEKINQMEQKRHLILCGSIDKELVAQYYQQANAVALLSISEGFGLGLIEGMHFGLPCMTFTDLDAFEDIYTTEAVVPIQERTDNAVAVALCTILSKVWNKENIKAYSKKFDSEEMAKQYVEFYKQ